ncbi:hypothetical protein IHE61_31245 [Streptomyces sp. GKU 257-1]|nr:hypothetical protein [Streptomyces sp. GKU 257-1]
MGEAFGEADEATRRGDPEAATSAYGDVHRHDHQAAESQADADTLRFEAATSYSTTVDGPPGPRQAGVQQPRGPQSAPQQQQQRQMPQRRGR